MNLSQHIFELKELCFPTILCILLDKIGMQFNSASAVEKVLKLQPTLCSGNKSCIYLLYHSPSALFVMLNDYADVRGNKSHWGWLESTGLQSDMELWDRYSVNRGSVSNWQLAAATGSQYSCSFQSWCLSWVVFCLPRQQPHPAKGLDPCLFLCAIFFSWSATVVPPSCGKLSPAAFAWCHR